MRVTYRLVQLAQAMLDDLNGKYWGYQLMRETGVPSGVLYPLLTRMLDEGWVKMHTSRKTPTLGPTRRYYTLTAKGRKELAAVMKTAEDKGMFE